VGLGPDPSLLLRMAMGEGGDAKMDSHLLKPVLARKRPERLPAFVAETASVE